MFWSLDFQRRKVWLSRIASVVLILAAILRTEYFVASVSAQELVQNRDFETCNTVPWILYAPGGGYWDVINTTNHTPGGTCAARFFDVVIYQEPSIVPRWRYRLEAWLKADPGDNAFVGWYSNDGGNRQCGNTSSTSWVERKCEFMMPAGTTYFNISAWGNKSGYAAYADDFSFSSYLPNSIAYTQVSARGSMADIEWADPPLNGGIWVYHRTAIRNNPYFGEIGWQKQSDGSFRGLVAYLDTSTGTVINIPFSYSSGATRNFRTANFGSSQIYDFYYDYSTYITSRNLGFWDTADVTSGGEVVSGVESMGNVLHANNKYLTWSFGQWVYVPYTDSGNPLYKQKDITYDIQIIDGNNWRVVGP